jgi:hypothetical protein
MYQFSRAIYRELADEIIEGAQSAEHHGNHERVLRACEGAVERLATDRHYFARPARTLFNEIRWFFPLTSHVRVLRVIESRVLRASGCHWHTTATAPPISTLRTRKSCRLCWLRSQTRGARRVVPCYGRQGSLRRLWQDGNAVETLTPGTTGRLRLDGMVFENATDSLAVLPAGGCVSLNAQIG